MEVEIVRSRRRRKTVQAHQVGDVLRVSVPASLTRAEEEQWVNEMLRRMEKRRLTSGVDLGRRAAELSARFGLASPVAIRWADNQQSRWGSCTPAEATIRISSKLATEPRWVLDYVIVHELAHLHFRGHGKAFWRLVNRYPLAERARGFLIARGLGDAAGPSPDEPAPETCAGAPGSGPTVPDVVSSGGPGTAGPRRPHRPSRLPGPLALTLFDPVPSV